MEQTPSASAPGTRADDALSNAATPRVALVTGAAGIVGPGIIEALRQQGWKVAGAGSSLESFKRFEQMHRRPHPADLHLAGDLSVESECHRLVEEARARLGPLSLIVNCATAHKRPTHLADLQSSTIESLFRVDLFATLYLTQAALPDLERTRGQVIAISSVRAYNQTPGNIPYATVKAATEKMIEAMALDLIPQRVRVNCIRVGAVPGDSFLRPALDMLPDDLAERLYNDVIPRHLEVIGKATSTTRPGLPADIGNMVVFLTTPEAEFINAAVIPVDGAFGLLQHIKAATPITDGKNPSIAASWTKDTRNQLKAWLAQNNISHEI